MVTGHKYGAKRCIVTEDGTLFEVDQLKQFKITDVTGIKFDSKMEAQYYLFLLRRQKEGLINGIELQPTFVLQDKPKIKYVADFKIVKKDGTEEVIDVKGVKTQAFRLKVRMFKATHPGVTLKTVTWKHSMWIHQEVS